MIAIYKKYHGRSETIERFVDLVPSVSSALDAIEEDENGPCPGQRYELVQRSSIGPRSYATLWEHTTRDERRRAMSKWIKGEKDD